MLEIFRTSKHAGSVINTSEGGPFSFFLSFFIFVLLGGSKCRQLAKGPDCGRIKLVRFLIGVKVAVIVVVDSVGRKVIIITQTHTHTHIYIYIYIYICIQREKKQGKDLDRWSLARRDCTDK